MGKIKICRCRITSEKVDEAINFILLLIKIIFKQTRLMFKRVMKNLRDPMVFLKVVSILLLSLAFILTCPSTLN